MRLQGFNAMNNILHTRISQGQRLTFVVLLAMVCVLTLTRSSKSAHLLGRPISSSDGQINQSYLWATASGTEQHKGVDFPNPLGTYVYAVADGVVVDMEEGIPNGTNDPDEPWGNFVLIRHGTILRHYDKTSDSNAYTYTIYAHLRVGSVDPVQGASVSAGSHIADVDDTGNSSGHHLHFQVALNKSSTKVLAPDNTLESEIRSRNPELWLTPLNDTATAIGKITTSNGTPIENLVVCGIEKAASLYYTSSRTYSFPTWANPDDIFVENFGTTDVKPGTYSLHANDLTDGCSATPVDHDLGSYTFTANRVTYIGLYPSWLPAVRPGSGWDTTIYSRNHDTTFTSVSFTTLFSSSAPEGQRQRTTAVRAVATISDEPPAALTGVIVPSKDTSTLVMANYDGQPTAYSGVTAFNGVGSAGWERAGTKLFIPLFKKNWVGRSSRIYVTNTGMVETDISVLFYDEDGNFVYDSSTTILPYRRRIVSPPDDDEEMSDGVYSAVITSNSSGSLPAQPIAAMVLEGEGEVSYTNPAMYNAFSSGSTVLFAPLIKKNYLGNTTGITLQNISQSNANFTATYYDMSANPVGSAIQGTIPPNSPYVLYNPAEIPDGFLGSVRISSNQLLVGQMSEGNGSGGLRLMSNLALSGTKTIYLPLWYDNYVEGNSSWTSGVNVRNAHSSGQTITARWYNQSGDLVLTQTATLDNSQDTHNFYDTSLSGFIGSVMITAANGPIVAVSNARNWSAPVGTDAVFAFNGSNR